MVDFKKQLIDLCKDTVRRRIDLLSYDIDALKESLETENKSSVGDKHETGRARMQSEQEKLAYLMAELKEQASVLDRIDPSRSTDRINSENLVVTDRNIFFIAVPLGRVELGDQVVNVISPSSPLARRMIGLKAGQSLEFNGVVYDIRHIY